MQLKIEVMPESRIAYMRRTGPYGEGNYALMKEFKEWAKANGLFNKSAVILGVSQDNPAVTLPQNCRYDVCTFIPEDFVIQGDGVHETKFSGGKYAVFEVAHTAEAVKTAWGKVFAQLSAKGLKPDISRAAFERYKTDMVEKHLCEICVPV